MTSSTFDMVEYFSESRNWNCISDRQSNNNMYKLSLKILLYVLWQ